MCVSVSVCACVLMHMCACIFVCKHQAYDNTAELRSCFLCAFFTLCVFITVFLSASKMLCAVVFYCDTMYLHSHFQFLRRDNSLPSRNHSLKTVLMSSRKQITTNDIRARTSKSDCIIIICLCDYQQQRRQTQHSTPQTFGCSV